jgi:poly-gamma-glutamate synthesis protein (capsule biosynthesis protein)
VLNGVTGDQALRLADAADITAALSFRFLLRGFIPTLAVALSPSLVSQSHVPDRNAGTFTLALAGDTLMTRKFSAHQEPRFQQVVDLIRSVDAAFTNFEMLLHDYEPYPMNESGGTWMRGDPEIAKDIAWAGFDMVSRANNHAGDYGVEGMRLTTKYLAAAGIVQAGVGEDLDEAREAKFFESPSGRIAIISAASTFPDHSRAGRARASVRGRPGLNPLRYTTTYQVPSDRLESLRTLARELGLETSPAARELRFLHARFVPGPAPAIRTEPFAQDVEEIAAVVRNASRLADKVLVTIHAHEGITGDRSVPAQFLVSFAHAMIDAGADVFAAHGPHVVRGIEVYKGKPVLYSLGDFVFENDLVFRLPSDAYEQMNLGPLAGVADFDDARSDGDRRSYPADRETWESFVATVRWRGKALEDVSLHPISLGFGRPRVERGRPLVADAGLAAKIVTDVAERSKTFGTRITFENGLGHVVLTGSSSH